MAFNFSFSDKVEEAIKDGLRLAKLEDTIENRRKVLWGVYDQFKGEIDLTTSVTEKMFIMGFLQEVEGKLSELNRLP